MTGSAASTIGNINPFRYRSYYFDAETGWYYLNSRYYDPQVGRFLNADGIIGANGGILGYNMFAYCNNSPVNYQDKEGYFIGALFGAVIGGIGGFIGGAVSAAIKGENVWNGAISGAIGGATGGAVAGAIVEVFVSPTTAVGTAAMIGAISGIVGGSTSSIVTQTVNYGLNNKTLEDFELDWNDVTVSAATGGVFGAAGTAFGQSQAIVYGGEKIVSAMASSFFSTQNALTEIAYTVRKAIKQKKATVDRLLEQLS